MNATAAVPTRLDHIVLATPHLVETVRRFAELTGVEPILGGDHAGLGSRNYLVRFTDTSYLEIIGRNPDETVADYRIPFKIGGLTSTRIATWALRTERISAVIETAKEAGFDCGEQKTMSRRLPDGSLLSWTLTTPYADDSGVVPFLIDWSGSFSHPATMTVPQVDLLAFRALHPSPDSVHPVLTAIGADLEVAVGESGFELELRTPRGTVLLDSDFVSSL
ncbi:VOC family protein [Homoserinimonas sp. OAct 916]|uniref:VOC family protein n=1 Tax=Homoserinimonas sp. OAct 916 TaxID=2211450 RepID=UPI000DBE65DC|nr:VOC family protein [Homoserinimonas sp. OAct 916]